MKKMKKIKNKKLILIITILVGVITSIIILYFIFINKKVPSNIIIKDINFQEIEISWDKIKNINNYEVIISDKKITDKDIKENNNIKGIEVNNKNQLKYIVLSNTDYYITILGYKEKNNKRNYTNHSKIIKFHTKSLDIKKINDLSEEEITDKSIKLKWSCYTTDYKNLDKSDIKITYNLYSYDKKNKSINMVKENITECSELVEDLTSITTYQYQVEINALVDNKIVKSPLSNQLEIITKANKVSNVKAISNGTSSITITWDNYDIDKENAIITYSIYGSDSKDGEFKLLKDNINDITFTEKSLSDNKTRYYYIIANIDIENNKYESTKSEIVEATTDKKVSTYTSSSNTTSNNNGSSTSSKEAEARAVAKQIASNIKTKYAGSNDLTKIDVAAAAVNYYYITGKHVETGNDYYTAYGVFIKGESSCAGTTRALGMILEELGYTWTHVNENQWKHQWVQVTMDGQVGWADGMLGAAGYGEYPYQ